MMTVIFQKSNCLLGFFATIASRSKINTGHTDAFIVRKKDRHYEEGGIFDGKSVRVLNSLKSNNNL